MIVSAFMISVFDALEDTWKLGGSLETYSCYSFVDYGDGRSKMRMKYRMNAFLWYRGVMFSYLSDRCVEDGTYLDCCYALVSAKLNYLPTLQVLKSGGYLELELAEKIVPTEIGENYSLSRQTLGDSFWGHQLIKLFGQSRRGRRL